MRDDREKLRDILEAIERIDKYAIQGRQSFERNELIQTWFIQHLQIIGEAKECAM
ncbi:MAG: nucleotidyltransferase [Microcoleus sp. SIO2G3]|nr:nucleotidyltransferase [Microcoleus sp. SIO2G3]